MVQIRLDPNSPKVRVRKRRILGAASRAFRKKGFHEAGMRDIAAACGMTVGNLYYYFKNKQELLAFCQEDAASRLLELASWVARTGLPPEERLYLLIVGHVVCLNEGTGGSLAHMEVESLESRWRPRILELRDEFEAAVRETIAEGVESKRMRAVDPKVAAFALLGSVNWTVKWFRPDGGRSARSIGEDFADQLVRGLVVPDLGFEPPAVEVPSFGTSKARRRPDTSGE